jgi:lysophospholipase L1-like esterase
MLLLLLSLAQYPADRVAKWEKEVAGIEARLAKARPPAGGVVFTGSSTVRLWKLDESFPGAGYVNAGFGGSEIRDCTHFARRLVLPHRPKTVVFYAGGNDLASGRSPKQVAADFATFCKAVPEPRILFVSVRPSPARWGLFDGETETNRLVKAMCERDPRLKYVDAVPAMLGADGQPRPELFVEDRLHLNAEGYEVLTTVVGDALGRPSSPKR